MYKIHSIQVYLATFIFLYFTSENEVKTSAISKVKNANKVQIVINKK